MDGWRPDARLDQECMGEEDRTLSQACLYWTTPLDVRINKLMKNSLRRKWNKWNHSYSNGRLRRKPDLPNICQWILHAWMELTKKIIVKAFKKSGIFNAMGGTEDDLLWEVERQRERIRQGWRQWPIVCRQRFGLTRRRMHPSFRQRERLWERRILRIHRRHGDGSSVRKNILCCALS